MQARHPGLDTWTQPQKEHTRMEMMKEILHEQKRENKQKQRWLINVRTVAAAIVFLITVTASVYWTLNNQSKHLITQHASSKQMQTIALPDGSTVLLNAGSSLTYPEQFNGKNREVSLIGEGFFNVTKNPDKPFIVLSGDLSITVLGTSFNVRAYQQTQQNEVTVKTGRVQVFAGEGADTDVVIITPNQQAQYNTVKRKLTKSAVNSDQYLAWTKGIIFLDETPLSEVALILERWYDVRITFSNSTLGGCRISGKYKREELVNILESLKFMQKLEYRFINEKEVVFSGNRCNN